MPNRTGTGDGLHVRVGDEGPTIVVTSRSFGTGRADPGAWLEERGYRVERGDHRHDPETLRPLLSRAVAWIAGASPVTHELVDLAPHLRVLARYGVGVDAVDRAALAGRGITLTNTPAANSDAVADHAVGLMLAVLRHILEGDRALRNGDPPPQPGRELGSCTVGLLGFGTIGRGVGRRLLGFGAGVLAHDPFVETSGHDGVVLTDLGRLARDSDVLSLHCPPAARPVVDGPFLRQMAPGAVLVNTARAELVDEPAVAEALHAGRLAAGAFDVLSAEDTGASPLLHAPNVLVTPHIAGHTVDAIDRMGTTAAADVVRVLASEPPHHPVPHPA